ncbi:MAG: tRNA pseudouridine(55) synthase TruB [Actinomycetota bacterium]|nr:tRNA pseudouridine(55) synthase TruB [Actinomycetota bacterium]
MGGSSAPTTSDGVLVVDKPAGMGSTDVVRVLRRVTRQRRVGHTGTLDPDATGVLVVCLGRATRLVRFLQEGRKTYLAQVTFGVETTTQDASGQVVAERSAHAVTEGRLRQALTGFIGDIPQVPPMVSAVKVGGERLYDKARRGEVVRREPRTVTIHDIVVESFEAGERAHASLLVTCSSGTYIRTLAHDLGGALGCGASLAGLRRLTNGAFTVHDAHTLADIEGAAEHGELRRLVLTMAEAVRGLPSVEVDAETARAVATGRRLPATGLPGPIALVHRVGGEPTLVGIYADDDGHARAEAVFVQPSDLQRSESR